MLKLTKTQRKEIHKNTKEAYNHKLTRKADLMSKGYEKVMNFLDINIHSKKK